jgi:RNA polymerase sigma-70 factor (ECF subfamily)
MRDHVKLEAQADMDKPWEIDLRVYDDETALVTGLQQHDQMACTCLLKWFAPRLYRLALHLTANGDEAEDVMQEGFIQACKEIDRFEGRSSIGAWLHRIVLNAGLMRLRKRKLDTVPLVEQPSDEHPHVPRALQDWESEPGEQILTRELRDAIERAIRELPPTLRAAVVLRDLENLSTTEAAAALGIAESALKVRLHRGRQVLRAALLPYLEEQAAISEEPSHDHDR